MKLPQLEIDGVIYEMKKPRAKDWSEFVKFDAERKNVPLEEYVEKLCEFMATQFEGVTADELLDKLYLEEVQKKYFECARCIWDLLSGKFEELEKNSESVEAVPNALT